MNNNWKKLLFFNRSWPIRIWMWTAIVCLLFYLVKFSLITNPTPTEIDMILMAYGTGSLAVYVLIFQFDWS